MGDLVQLYKERAKQERFIPKTAHDYTEEEKALQFDLLLGFATTIYNAAKVGSPIHAADAKALQSLIELLGDDAWKAFQRFPQNGY